MDTKDCKRCSACRQVLPLENFHKHRTTLDGFSCYCKTCACVRARLNHAKNKEKSHARSKSWRDRNKQKIAVRMKKWRAEHPEYQELWRAEDPESRIRAYARKHYWADPARARASTVKWKKNNQEKVKTSAKESREKNPSIFKARTKKWRENNPDAVKAMKARGRAKKRMASVVDFTKQQWRILRELYNHCCAYCGKPQKRLT